VILILLKLHGGVTTWFHWRLLYHYLSYQQFITREAKYGELCYGSDVVGFFNPAAGDMLMIVAGPLYLIWFPLVAHGLFKLAKTS